MSEFTREDQRRIWDAEHATPQVLLQMDSNKPSSGVTSFYEFLKDIPGDKKGAELGSGKGRNIIWLAQQAGITHMYGLDFSSAATEEAERRAKERDVSKKTTFSIQDVAEKWPFGGGELDFVIDCFATTDIETPEARKKAVAESFRVLRPKGYLLVYTLSTDDEFHKEMVRLHPAQERNAFFHPTGKFEKTFDAKELGELHKDFTLVESRRIEKVAVFSGKDYACRHFWNIYQKP